MLVKTGIVGDDLLKKTLPTPQRRAQGPYAVIECFQKIPCNPCSIACPFHAILPMEDINDLPQLDADLCTGCGICAGVCPGLAIFIIDESAGDGSACITLPYEFSPLPKKGDWVQGLDREGRKVAPAQVDRVVKGKRTPLVTLKLPAEHVQDLRFFSYEPEDKEEGPALTCEVDGSSDPELMEEETMVCRCEGVTLGEIRRLIREGYQSVDEIKRISRAGMGPCQSRTCGPLIASEIARMTGRPLESVEPSAQRPPVKALPIAFFMKEDE